MNRIILYYLLLQLAGISQISAQGIKSVLDNEVNPGEVLMEFDNRDREIVGNYYIDQNWKKGNIVLKSGTEIKNQLIRFDLEYDLLEVKLPGNLKVVPLRKLDYFRIIDVPRNNEFQNCDRFSFEDGTVLSGICQVLVDGYYGAIIKYAYDIKEATYVPALDMGKETDEILIRKYPFIVQDGTVYRIPGRKKNFYELFGNPEVDVKSFIRTNHLNYKREDDLISILQYANKQLDPE